ncbi:MAG: protein translocase subunit YidC [Candidatus Eisenbacteria bacterium]|jgi:YidC/Oxa1 family membrane protein insertase
MDRRTTIALVLCMLVFALFTAMQTKYMPKPVPRPTTAVADSGATPVAAPPVAGLPSTTTTGIAPAAPESAVPAVPAVETRRVTLETDLYRATFNSLGARLESFELKHYSAAWGTSRFGRNPHGRPGPGKEVPAGDRVELRGAPLFAFDLGSDAARRSLATTPFAIEESLGTDGRIAALTFVAADSAGGTIRQTWRPRVGTYLLDLDISVNGASLATNEWSLVTRSWPLLTEVDPEQDARMVRGVSLVGKDVHRDGAQGLINKNPKVREGVVVWGGVQSHYFLGVLTPNGTEGRRFTTSGEGYVPSADERKLLPPAGKPERHPIAIGTLVMGTPANGSQRFAAYFGPADYFGMAEAGGAGRKGSLQIDKAVDMGFSWLLPFSYPLLQLLRLLESWVRNYGLAIFLLATVVRLLLHPLNMSSMRSMKAMTKLQPEIERLREKYKNDAATMNTAVMALYKENKVNPAGGCLPMLLQMPLFFALYAVLSNSIQLRQAPFVGWIHDLAAPDLWFEVAGFPIRLLPIIMAGSGFLQQRLTPTPAQQQSMMYMMNFVMLFIFYNLPSGLVFYWTLMNLYTVLQQWMVNRGSDSGVVVRAGAVRAK